MASGAARSAGPGPRAGLRRNVPACPIPATLRRPEDRVLRGGRGDSSPPPAGPGLRASMRARPSNARARTRERLLAARLAAGCPRSPETGMERRAGRLNDRDGLVLERVSLPGERQPSSLRTLRSRPNPPLRGVSASLRGAVSAVRPGRVSVTTPPLRQASRGVESAPRLGAAAFCAGRASSGAEAAVSPSRRDPRVVPAGARAVRRSDRRRRADSPDPAGRHERAAERLLRRCPSVPSRRRTG